MAQKIPVRRTLPQTQDQFQGSIPDGRQLIDQSTPTRKTAERPRNGPEGYNRPPSCPPNLPVTPRQVRPYQTGPELQIALLQYDPEVTTQSSPPQAPTCKEENFFTQGNSHMETDWADDDIHFTRSHRIQEMLKDLAREVEMAEAEGYLKQVLEDSAITELMIRLSALVPCLSTKSQTDKILAGILDIKSLVRSMSTETDRPSLTPNESYASKTLSSSRHAPGQAPEGPGKKIPNTNSHTSAASKNESTKKATPSDQFKKTPTNPNAAHHPSRVVINFSPNGLPQDARPSPQQVVTTLNQALGNNPQAKHLKIVVANFNYQGNLIVSTRSDQTAAELIKFRETFRKPLGNICSNREMTIKEDKKWYKIQIDGVSTSFSPSENKFGLHYAETVHEELSACNPSYAKLQDTLSANPKWLRTEEELTTTPRSSLVFALSDEDTARTLLDQKTLADFGRHCSLRAFQDRPPVTQCRKCWKFDHTTHKCKDQEKCRICGGPHSESEHTYQNPTDCTKCMAASMNGDDTMSDESGPCPHSNRCANCVTKTNTDHDHPADARRCPTRLAKYGTARENERRASKNSNPWAKPPPQPKNPPQKPNQPRQQPRTTRLNDSNDTENIPPEALSTSNRSTQQQSSQIQYD